MTTAIAIVGFRNSDDILTCLAALQASTATDYSVHICENGGLPAARSLAVALGAVAEADADAAGEDLVWAGRLAGGQPVRVVSSGRNTGYAGGVNAGIRDALAAMPEWRTLWVLNPDTRPAPEALAAMRARLAEGYGMVGCRLVLSASNRVQLYGGRWRPLMARGFNIGLHAPADATPDIAAVERETTYVNGASMLVSRAFVDSVGPMDERYFLYNEEVDWCFRRGDFRLGYAHEAVVLHDHGSTIGSSISRRQRSRLSVYLDERNKLLFTRRFFPALYPLTVLVTLALTAQYLRHAAVLNFFVALSGWLAGVRGLEGPPPFLPMGAPPETDASASGEPAVPAPGRAAT